MENFDRKKHWENIYQSKSTEEVSWFQPRPERSLGIIEGMKLPASAKIIDVGGGDSLLVDHLLDLGYENITVLDISEAAIARAKQRLGARASHVQWIVADAATFEPTTQYDLWHDRAAFHFLTQDAEIAHYLHAAHHGLAPNGHLVIGTFSDQGPKKCSGIDIKQYSETNMTEGLSPLFEKINCRTVDHTTPSGGVQNFLFCHFRKRVKG
jgi:SAM-dependent methyltransferase